MSKNCEQEAISVNYINCWSKLIKGIFSYYKIPINERFYIKSIFFKKFYKLRKINELLEEKEIIIEYQILKKIIHSCVVEINNYLELEISYQKVLNIFLKNLGVINLKENVQLNFTNLSINCMSKNKVSVLTQCEPLVSKNNNPSKWAISTLFKFLFGKENKTVPFELVMILIADAQKIYSYNKEFFVGTNVYKVHLIEESIMLRIKQIGDVIYSNNDCFYYRNEPYKKTDLDIQFLNLFSFGTFSLPYLVDYFGHSSWYKSFIFNKKEEFENYVKFNVLDF